MKKYKLATILLLLVTVCLSGCTSSDLNDFIIYLNEYASNPENNVSTTPPLNDKKDKSADTNTVKIEVIESVSYDRYAYQNIDEDTQVVYDQVLDCIKRHAKEVDISTTDETVLDKAYRSVFADYGGLFWVNGYVYHKYYLGDVCTKISFEPKYTMSYEERENYQKQIDTVVADWLSGISITDSDYDKAKYVFDIIVENVDYNVTSEENQNIISVFLNGESVCQGYANAVWYLFDELGIPCTIITGKGKGESHAWNLVYLDKAYYFMDATWGDADYSRQTSSTNIPRYSYFAMTSEAISRTHVADTVFVLPGCINLYDNYYIRSNRYYDSWVPDDIGRTYSEQLLNNGAVGCDIMFGSDELYNQAIQYFITDSNIYKYLVGVKSITYIPDDDSRVLTIFLQ